MNRKLIFLDIDGTLTEPGKNIPPQSALEAINRARLAGHKVFLCTGRNYDMLKPLLQYDFDGLIASSGGYIEADDKVIYDHPMTETQKKKAMRILEENHVYRTVECKDGSYTDDGFKEFLRENAGQGENSELLRWREQIEASLGIQSMKNYRDQPIYKIVMMGLSMEDMLKSKEELGEEFSFVLQETKGRNICNGELIIPDYDKGQAIERIASYYGQSMNDTIGFGDSMNDLEMIEMVGTSVCMENGSEELKKKADYVCPSYDKDGLYLAFVKYNLL